MKQISLPFFIVLAIVAITVDINAQQTIPALNWPIETIYNDSGFTEGPVIAPDGNIYFSDMDKSVIFKHNPENGTTQVWQPDSKTSNGLYIHKNHLYACEATGRAVVRYDLNKGSESRYVLADNYKGNKFGSPNDLSIIDKYLYFSEFFLGSRLKPLNAQREIFVNRVYQLSLNDFSLDTLKTSFIIPNGVAKLPDNKTFFVSDIRSQLIHKATLKKGEITGIEEFIDLSFLGKAGPDGMAISKNGTLFIALFGAGKLIVIDKNANPLGFLETGSKTTNCVLSEDESTLYVTANGKLKKATIPKSFLE